MERAPLPLLDGDDRNAAKQEHSLIVVANTQPNTDIHFDFFAQVS